MNTLFIFVGCKIGFETQCKAEVMAQCPNLRFSFSRPGFLTFKVAEGSADFSILNRLTFARIAGQNVGKIRLEQGTLPESEADKISQLLKEHPCGHLHYWSRELGKQDDELLLSSISGDLPESASPFVQLAEQLNLKFNRQARNNQTVLNLIAIEQDEIWLGIHRVESPQQSFPGGVIRFPVPEKPISRAYFKMKEALIWSRFPLQKNDVCIEIGCSPGGAALALLEQEMEVIGIDPADVDEQVNGHPNFTHIKKRGADVRKKLLANGRWLMADSNVAPQHTLDTVEEISSNQHIHLRGLILTLKLLSPEMSGQIDAYRQRVLKMGFQYVRTRQLAFNRNEICLAALKRKSLLRFGKQNKTQADASKPTKVEDA